MTNRTLNREKAVRQPPTWCLSTSGGVLRVEEWDFQLPGGTTGMLPWLREVGAPCHCSSSGLRGTILGYGMVLSPWAVIKFLIVLLTLTPALWGGWGVLLRSSESGNPGSSLSLAGPGRGRHSVSRGVWLE